MPRAKNPFFKGTKTGYNNPTMATTANNIGGLLLGGETPNAQAARESKAALEAKHGALYEAQTREADAKATEKTNRAAYQTVDAFKRAAKSRLGYAPDTPDEAVAPEHAKEINGYVGHLLTAQGLPGNSTYDQFQHGVGRAREQALGDDVLAGRRTAPSVAVSQGAVAGKPMVDIKDHQVFNPYDIAAPRQTTDVGRSIIGHTDAQTKTEGERQKTEGAKRGHLGALTTKAQRESMTETLDGVNPDGSERYKLVPRSVGSIITKRGQSNPKAHAVPFNQADEIDSEINTQLGVRLDKDTKKPVEGSQLPLHPDALTRIRTRAAELYQESGDGPGSVQAAIKENALADSGGETRPWYRGGDKKPTQRALAPKTPANLSDDELLKELNK